MRYELILGAGRRALLEMYDLEQGPLEERNLLEERLAPDAQDARSALGRELERLQR